MEAHMVCHGAAASVLSTVRALASKLSKDGTTLSLADLDTICGRVLGVQSVQANLMTTFNGCMSAAKTRYIDARRTNAFTRLMMRPLEPLFDDPASGVTRQHIFSLRHALTLLLSEPRQNEMARQASLIAARYHDNEVTDWEAFFADPDAIMLRELALLSIAKGFEGRFATRRDWFITLMNTNPASVALGSSAFAMRPADERETPPFTKATFTALMLSWMAPVHPTKYDAVGVAEFQERHCTTPAKAFGPLFVELRR